MLETRNSVKLSRLWNTGFGLIATRSIQVIFVGLLVAIALKMILTVQLVLLPILIALILAAALWPLVRTLRHKMSALLAAWTALLGSMIVLGGVTTLIAINVSSQWSILSQRAIQGFQKAQEYIVGFISIIDQKQIDDLMNQLRSFLSSAQFGAGALSGISALGSFVTGLLLTFVILFFFLKDGDRMWRFLLSWLPSKDKDYWERSGVQAVLTLGDYIRGTAIIAAVDALGIGIALMILQVPLAIPLTIIVFIGSFIPMVGATIAGVLASLIALVTNDLTTALIVAGVVVLVNQLEGNFLQPKVMSKALSVHGLVILVTLTIGTVLGGIVGAVLSVPLTATFWAIVKIWTHRQTAEDIQRLEQVMDLERHSPHETPFGRSEELADDDETPVEAAQDPVESLLEAEESPSHVVAETVEENSNDH